MHLIADVQKSWKLLTIHVAAVWAIVVGAYVADPQILVSIWHQIPDEMRPEIPHWAKGVAFGATLFMTIFGARVVAQKKPDTQEK